MGLVRSQHIEAPIWWQRDIWDAPTHRARLELEEQWVAQQLSSPEEHLVEATMVRMFELLKHASWADQPDIRKKWMTSAFHQHFHMLHKSIRNLWADPETKYHGQPWTHIIEPVQWARLWLDIPKNLSAEERFNARRQASLFHHKMQSQNPSWCPCPMLFLLNFSQHGRASTRNPMTLHIWSAFQHSASTTDKYLFSSWFTEPLKDKPLEFWKDYSGFALMFGDYATGTGRIRISNDAISALKNMFYRHTDALNASIHNIDSIGAFIEESTLNIDHTKKIHTWLQVIMPDRDIKATEEFVLEGLQLSDHWYGE